VYIAREGFKDNPIGVQEWEAAVRQCKELQLDERSRGPGGNRLARLRGGKGTHLSRTPYGLLHTQNPPIEMIRVMFSLANVLGAGVYSEDLERYASVEDWDQRTAEYRRNLSERRKIAKRKRRTRYIVLVLVVAISAVVGFIV
jgi:hypothetical protein